MNKPWHVRGKTQTRGYISGHYFAGYGGDSNHERAPKNTCVFSSASRNWHATLDGRIKLKQAAETKTEIAIRLRDFLDKARDLP